MKILTRAPQQRGAALKGGGGPKKTSFTPQALNRIGQGGFDALEAHNE